MISKVSVIMPLYNKGLFVAKSIESVLNQIYGNFELIIINDCSTDNSLEIATQYESKDDRIIIIQNNLNIGVTKSMNKAIQTATGNYIARIDADDIWLANKLQIQLNAFNADEDLILLATSKININEDGDAITDFAEPGAMKHDDIVKYMLCKKNIFVHSSIIFKRNIIDHIGLYNEKYIVAEDVEFIARVANKYKVEILNDVLVHYRISNNMLSKKHRRYHAQLLVAIKLKWIFRYKYPARCYLGLIPEIIQSLKPNFAISLKQRIMNSKPTNTDK